MLAILCRFDDLACEHSIVWQPLELASRCVDILDNGRAFELERLTLEGVKENGACGVLFVVVDK